MILMCNDRREAGCATSQQMSESWKHLKRRLREEGLSQSGGISRLGLQCCGVCKAGPIVMIVPDGCSTFRNKNWVSDYREFNV